MSAHFGWLVANILVPFLFPLLIILLMQHLLLDLKDEQRERMRLTYLLREAQLSVASLAIASAAFYEILHKPAVLQEVWGVVLLIATIILGIFNAILFVCGTVIGSTVPKAQSGINFKEWRKQYPLADASIWLAIATSLAAFVAHIVVDEHHSVGTAQAAPTSNSNTSGVLRRPN